MVNNLDSLAHLRELFYANPENPDHAKNYAEAIRDCLFDELIDLDEAKDELLTIQQQFPRLYRIKNFIAETLAPWEIADIEEIEDALSDIEDYYHRNPENESLAESYALSLWLLYDHPQARNKDTVLSSLSELINAFPDNETIAEKYYQVLDLQEEVIITESKQGKPKRISIQEPKKLVSDGDALKYAKTLLAYVNQETGVKKIQKAFWKFDSLIEQFPHNECVKEYYAKALYSALSAYEEEKKDNILKNLSKLQSSSASTTVAEMYALALEEMPIIDWDTIQVLQSLYELFPRSESIIDSLGYALRTLLYNNRASTEKYDDALQLFDKLRAIHPEIDSLQDPIH